MYAERKPPATPPCESCRVELKVENEDAARIFMMIRGQVLTRFNGQADVIIDLNHLAVWAAIDAYGVRNRTGTFEKVLNLFHAILKEQRESE
jgi:hypothetical protein